MGTTIARRLPANGMGGPMAKPSSTSFCAFVTSADAKTSAGWPCSILVRNALEASKLSVTVAPGRAPSYAVEAAVNAALRDEAARTVMGDGAPDETWLAEPVHAARHAAIRRRAGALARTAGASASGDLHDDVCGLHDAHRLVANLQIELFGGFRGHETDEPMWT